jgi:hypothetical protein
VAIAFHCLGHYNVGMDVWVGLHSPGYMYTWDVQCRLPVSDDTAATDVKLMSAAGQFSADPDPSRGDSAASITCLYGPRGVLRRRVIVGRWLACRCSAPSHRVQRDPRGRGQLRASSSHHGAPSCIVYSVWSLV